MLHLTGLQVPDVSFTQEIREFNFYVLCSILWFVKFLKLFQVLNRPSRFSRNFFMNIISPLKKDSSSLLLAIQVKRNLHTRHLFSRCSENISRNSVHVFVLALKRMKRSFKDFGGTFLGRKNCERKWKLTEILVDSIPIIFS